MQRTATITLATALMASLMVCPIVAFGSETEATIKTWVFVQNCDNATIEGLNIPNSEVVCFPRASIINIKENVELLRQVFPNDIFVFTYDLRNAYTARDFTLFLRTNDSAAPMDAKGFAFVKEGYAIAANNHLVVEHEYLHISTCSVAHNAFGEPDISKKTSEQVWC